MGMMICYFKKVQLLIEQLLIFAFVKTTYLVFEGEVVCRVYVQGSGRGLCEYFRMEIMLFGGGGKHIIGIRLSLIDILRGQLIVS